MHKVILIYQDTIKILKHTGEELRVGKPRLWEKNEKVIQMAVSEIHRRISKLRHRYGGKGRKNFTKGKTRCDHLCT